MMDYARKRSRLPAIGRSLIVVSATVALATAALWGAGRLFDRRSVLPSVDRSAIITDVVRRGPLVRSIDAPGLFAPRSIHVIDAPDDATVTSIAVHPGSRVAPGDEIARMRDPALDAAIVDLDAQIAAARALLRSITDQAKNADLAQSAALRAALADDEQANAQIRVDTSLHAQGLIPELQYRISTIRARAAHDKVALGSDSLAATASDGVARIAAQRATITGLLAKRDAQRAKRDALFVRAGDPGTIQSVAAEQGARVLAGAELARIAADGDLEAIVQVAEGDARSVVPGMAVDIAAGSARVAGSVTRVEPAALNGAVPMHVALDRLPPFARPAMHIDASIVLERVANVLSIARPAGIADLARASLYVVAPGGARADRVPVMFGRGSLQRVAVRAGLAENDTVIISDVDAQDAPRIAIR